MIIKNKPKAEHLQKGNDAEKLALDYLKQQGLDWVCSNYKCKTGELDLIMKHGAILVIVEVRYRKSDLYGGALSSITKQKQLRIISATQHYVIINNLNHLQIRFDVVAISADKGINWIKNAFQT